MLCADSLRKVVVSRGTVGEADEAVSRYIFALAFTYVDAVVLWTSAGWHTVFGRIVSYLTSSGNVSETWSLGLLSLTLKGFV